MSVLSDQLGKPIARVDGIAKVTGAARYASDEPVPHPAFAYLITSRIARGKIRAFDLTEARAVPGVIDILTYENVGGGFDPAKGPDGGTDNHDAGKQSDLARRADDRHRRCRDLRSRARGGAQIEGQLRGGNTEREL